MHPRSAAIVAAARACVGTCFRPQGRTPGLALDCVGVALVAARAAGVELDVPVYGLGGDREPRLDLALATSGLSAVDVGCAGDLLVVAPSDGRRHLGIITSRGIVHAHAGLGRVVEGPCDPAWPVVGAWRLPMGAN